MTVCCADIPKLPGLQSIRLRAGLQGGNRVIRWPYVAENDSIASWVRGGELVFVTGINHARSEENLCQLVREGVASNCAGLVILTGPEFIREIPNNVLALANELNFPVLEQPYELKMVLVTEVISNTLVQNNLTGQSLRLFLTRLINGFADAPELVHLRAQELGVRDDNACAVVALRANLVDGIPVDSPEFRNNLMTRLEQQLGDLLHRRDIHWPILPYEQDLLMLWPTGDQAAVELHEELQQALTFLQKQNNELDLYLGVSERQTGLLNLGAAVEEARHACQFVVQQGQQHLFFYEQLGIAKIFTAMPNRRLLAVFCQEHLGELCFARDTLSLELKSTLTTYLNYASNQQQASVALGIHRNTLNNRLRKIEHLTKQSLQDPFQRLNIQNALLIEQILFQHHNLKQ